MAISDFVVVGSNGPNNGGAQTSIATASPCVIPPNSLVVICVETGSSTVDPGVPTNATDGTNTATVADLSQWTSNAGRVTVFSWFDVAGRTATVTSNFASTNEATIVVLVAANALTASWLGPTGSSTSASSTAMAVQTSTSATRSDALALGVYCCGTNDAAPTTFPGLGWTSLWNTDESVRHVRTMIEFKNGVLGKPTADGTLSATNAISRMVLVYYGTTADVQAGPVDGPSSPLMFSGYPLVAQPIGQTYPPDRSTFDVISSIPMTQFVNPLSLAMGPQIIFPYPQPYFPSVGAATILQALTATVTTLASFQMQVGKTLTATVTSTAAIVKQVGKLLTATSVSTATVVKRVNKAVTATVSTTATMLAQKAVLIAMTATVTTTATMIRQTGKIVSATATTTANMSRSIAKTVTATVTTSATITKQIAHTLTATVSSLASLVATFISGSAVTILSRFTSNPAGTSTSDPALPDFDAPGARGSSAGTPAATDFDPPNPHLG